MTNPYKKLPEFCFWRNLSNKPLEELENIKLEKKFQIKENYKVSSAGSCFAKNISKFLVNNTNNYFITEKKHDLISEAISQKFNYEVYSARYGNIYTAKQLYQLLLMSQKKFFPIEKYWTVKDRYIDPIRPLIQPNGFNSKKELLLDRVQHLEFVYKMFKESDVFIFTLGLTELWINKLDGTAYPVCPLVVNDKLNKKSYQFINQNFSQVLEDMTKFISSLKKINKKIKIVLTVSPVPLVATAEKRDVLISNVYSKSVLRNVAEELQKKNEDIYYFPSFEIITSLTSKSFFYENNFRDVTELGVQLAMNCFKKNFLSRINKSDKNVHKIKSQNNNTNLMEKICEEKLLEV